MPAVEAAAKRASIPVAIQLDHGSSLNAAIMAINLGCNGIMLDATNMSLPDNISATKAVVDMSHSCGVPVIGEPGYVAGVEGEGAAQHLVKPNSLSLHRLKPMENALAVIFLPSRPVPSREE